MANADAIDDGQPEPTGPTWKFFAAYFGGIALLAVGIVAAVSMTGGKGGGETQAEDTAKAGSPATRPNQDNGPVRVTAASSERVHLSGDSTAGWILTNAKLSDWEFVKLSDGIAGATLPSPQNGFPQACSPSGALAVHYLSGPRQWVSVYRLPGKGTTTFTRATTFTPYPDDKVAFNPYTQPGSRPAGGLALCRILDDERILTVHANGGFDLWSPEGKRLGGQAGDPAVVADPELREGGLGRTLSLTADNRTLARANADGFTVFDVPTSAGRVKTDSLSALEPDRKLRTLLGTALRADGSQLAALVLFPTRLITAENRFPVAEDYRDHLWLVVFDATTGKRVSATKLKNLDGQQSQFDQLSWWGDRHVLVSRAAYDVTTGNQVGRFTQLNGVDYRHETFGPDDRYWAIVADGETLFRTVIAVAPPADLPPEGAPLQFRVTKSGLQKMK